MGDRERSDICEHVLKEDRNIRMQPLYFLKQGRSIPYRLTVQPRIDSLHLTDNCRVTMGKAVVNYFKGMVVAASDLNVSKWWKKPPYQPPLPWTTRKKISF